MKISKIMILFFYAISLFGQTFPEKIAIFPFRVNIQIENPTPHPETELPLLFQDATIFLSKTLYQHEFLESSYPNPLRASLCSQNYRPRPFCQPL